MYVCMLFLNLIFLPLLQSSLVANLIYLAKHFPSCCLGNFKLPTDRIWHEGQHRPHKFTHSEHVYEALYHLYIYIYIYMSQCIIGISPHDALMMS